MLLFFLFLAELFILFLLSRQVTRSVSYLLYFLSRSKRITIHVMAFLFFPGTLIHELSHAIMAGLLGVRVGTMEFLPVIEGDRVKLGSVQVAHTDFFRRFLIGAAPFLTGTVLILGLLYYVSNNQLFDNIWVTLLIGYAVFEIGNTMFSSKKDMEGAVELLGTITIIALIIYLVGVPLPALNTDAFFAHALVKDILEKGSLFLLVPIVLDLTVIGILKIIKR